MKNDKKESRSKKFGRWVEQERVKIIDPNTRKPITQDDAADRAGISRIHWNRIEKGATGVKKITAKQIAEALGRKTEDEINEVLKQAGFYVDEEPFQLPSSMRRFPDLSSEHQEIIVRLVETLYKLSKTRKRGKR